jgi:hypothetical protein
MPLDPLQEIAGRLITFDQAVVDAFEQLRTTRDDPNNRDPRVSVEQYHAWRKGLDDALSILRPLHEQHIALERWRTGAAAAQLQLQEVT